MPAWVIGGHGACVPSGDPGGEGRPALAGEAGAPVVEAAGGGEGGADLGHGEADGHGEGAGDEPAEGHGGGPAEGEARVVERGDPRQHRDDGEGEGEVGQHPGIENAAAAATRSPRRRQEMDLPIGDGTNERTGRTRGRA